MKQSVHGLALLIMAGLAYFNSKAGETNAPSLSYSPPAPMPVETVRYDWVDAKRERKIPVKIYFPKVGKGPFPVIIFSHGLGGSREGYEYLGRHWAERGYVSVHVQHLGSDDAVWKGMINVMQKMRKSVADVQNSINRPLDVTFVIDELERMNQAAGPWQGRLDLQRIGVAGHSFGAFTTLAIAGESFPAPAAKPRSLADSRVKAAIAMSSPVTLLSPRVDQAYGSIKIPVFHMTGTKDDSPIGETKAADRRVPFDHINGADQYFVTFQDGDHMIFSGRGAIRTGRKDKAFQKLICAGSQAFWDAYLKDDPAAKQWLANGGFAKELDKAGAFETKLRP